VVAAPCWIARVMHAVGLLGHLGQADDIRWRTLPSSLGELPVPGPATLQTGAVVADFDQDGHLDILNKPYTWQTPRVDVWLNEGTERPQQ
jgi:hypothetical protein